jgi:hypothetical protein
VKELDTSRFCCYENCVSRTRHICIIYYGYLSCDVLFNIELVNVISNPWECVMKVATNRCYP